MDMLQNLCNFILVIPPTSNNFCIKKLFNSNHKFVCTFRLKNRCATYDFWENEQLAKPLLATLQKVLRKNNPFVQRFQQHIDMVSPDSNIPDYNLVLLHNSNSKKMSNPKLYNKPVAHEIAGILPTGINPAAKRDIVIKYKQGIIC